MLNNHKDEQLTQYLLQFCYTCDRGHECTTAEMTIACMKEKHPEAACRTAHDETRELLRWYEQA